MGLVRETSRDHTCPARETEEDRRVAGHACPRACELEQSPTAARAARQAWAAATHSPLRGAPPQRPASPFAVQPPSHSRWHNLRWITLNRSSSQARHLQTRAHTPSLRRPSLPTRRLPAAPQRRARQRQHVALPHARTHTDTHNTHDRVHCACPGARSGTHLARSAHGACGAGASAPTAPPFRPRAPSPRRRARHGSLRLRT